MAGFNNSGARAEHCLLSDKIYQDEEFHMRCPYCNEAMEKGLIESSEPINFLKEVRFVNKANEAGGGAVGPDSCTDAGFQSRYGKPPN